MKILVRTDNNGGYDWITAESLTQQQINLATVTTTEKNALTIPAGVTPLVFDSTLGMLQFKLSGTWYSIATTAYADALVVGLWDDRGNYDASGNTFPASGGSGTAGAILKGDVWTTSVAGTLGGTAVRVGDTIRALANTPGQTAGNWAISENNFGYTPENVVNKATSFAEVNNTVYPTVQAVVNYLAAQRYKNGLLYNEVTDVGTAADVLEKTLKTYTLPGGTLSSDGSTIEVEAILYTASNGNNKTAKIYFGGTLIGSTGALGLDDTNILIKATINRSAAGGQKCIVTIAYGTSSGIDDEFIIRTTTTIDLTADAIIKITGENGTATANDLVAQNMIIKLSLL